MITPSLNKMRAAAKVFALILALITTLSARVVDTTTEAGTVISNRAEATYSDVSGDTYTTVSPTVTVTVLAVATVVVTPDETASSATIAPHDQVTRLFRICNTGNYADTFSVIR